MGIHNMVKQKRFRSYVAVAAAVLALSGLVYSVPPAWSQSDGSAKEEYNELNEQIEQKKLQLQEIDEKIKQYESSLESKQAEALTIEGQISLLEGQIVQTNADVERISLEVERTGLEIQQAELDIQKKREQLEILHTRLADYIRLLNELDQQTVIDALLAEGSVSEFFSRVQYAEDISGKLKENTLTVRDAKDDLESYQKTQESKKVELTALQDRLAASVSGLQSQQAYKSDLLAETKEDQEVFEDLLSQAQREQKQVDAEIFNIEKEARTKLEDEGSSLLDSVATLSWPVASHKGISAYFHDPSYIFRKYFEHPAIDIRVGQGTALYAPADGYISRAKNAGMGYSFIMIIHNNQLSTVFGHVSRIDVSEEQFVRRGQQIGLSGGMPGTPGAGNLTTGPHLHFEVRLNGIPVNPLDYLP